MRQPNSTRTLKYLAVIGTLLFIVLNWWPVFTGNGEGETDNDVAAEEQKLTKSEAADKAVAFVQSHFSFLAETVDSYAVYQTQQRLSGYVEKYELNERYEDRFSKRIPLEYYQVEIRNPYTKQRFFVGVQMETGIVFRWTVKESVKNAADAINAEPSFLRTVEKEIKEMGYDPKQFSLLHHDKLPNKVGPLPLVYESKKERIGSAPLQLHIGVSDGKVSSFRPQFKLPASYLNWFDRQADAAALMGTISLILSGFMFLAAIVMAFRYRKSITFSRGIGLAICFAVIYGLNNISMYPGLKAQSGEIADTGLAAMSSVLFMQFIIFLMAASLYLSLVSGEAIWRRQGWDSWPRFRQPSFGRQLVGGMKQGYLAALFLLGVQAALFFAADIVFRFWSIPSPTDTPDNMMWPSLFPTMAWAAAISEEAIYRVFGIAIFKKWFRSTFLAILIPSVIWAMGHTEYQIYPVYTRLIEVTILGLLFGYIFLKYGFVTVLFAHAVMDSILMSFSLIGMAKPSYIIAAIIYVAFPALIAYTINRLHRRFTKDPLPPRPEAH